MRRRGRGVDRRVGRRGKRDVCRASCKSLLQARQLCCCFLCLFGAVFAESRLDFTASGRARTCEGTYRPGSGSGIEEGQPGEHSAIQRRGIPRNAIKAEEAAAAETTETKQTNRRRACSRREKPNRWHRSVFACGSWGPGRERGMRVAARSHHKTTTKSRGCP